MSLGRRVRAMERKAGAEAAAPCRCSTPILAVGPGEERRVFPGYREFYGRMVQGLPPPPVARLPDGGPAPVPERCEKCGRVIDYVRVRVGWGPVPHGL